MAVERVRRQKAGQERDEAIAARLKADDRLCGRCWLPRTPRRRPRRRHGFRAIPAGSDAATDTEPSRTRKACITVQQTIRRRREDDTGDRGPAGGDKME
jgi:hypothetical protein